MKFFRNITLPFLIALLFNSLSYGRAEVDSTFLKYISEGWNAAKESKYSDSVQNKYAAEFYNYYKNNNSTEVGKKAIESAMTMWGNTGNADMMDKAIASFDYDQIFGLAQHTPWVMPTQEILAGLMRRP